MAIDYTRRDRPRPSTPAPPQPASTPSPERDSSPTVPVDSVKIAYSKPGRERPASQPVDATSRNGSASTPPSRPLDYSKPNRPTIPPPSTTGNGTIRSRVEDSGAAAADSTLVTAARTLRAGQAEQDRFITHHVALAANSLTALLGALPDTSDLTTAMTNSHTALVHAMAARFSDKMHNLYVSEVGPRPTPDLWISSADALTFELQNRRVPMTGGGRDRDWQQFSQQYKAVVGHFESLLLEVYSEAHSQGLAMIKQWPDGNKPSDIHHPAGTFPAMEVSEDDLVHELEHLRTGLGPLWFNLGRLMASEVTLKLSSGNGKQSDEARFPVQNFLVPATIDLDAAGGFRTSTPILAERIILQFIATMPADQVKVRVFDPLKLGDSASFLYGLGDIADRVIGDKVKTTDREIDELLQETEEHITQVTQKYLQGEHDSLTAYNIAAKMVTEPYRILLLYGFPAGFKRQEHLDKDRLDRLAKIVDGGARAGVFTILVSDEVSYQEYVETGDRWNRQVVEAEHVRYISKLPFYAENMMVDKAGFAGLVGINDSAMRVRTQGAVARSGARLNQWKIFADLANNEFELRWSILVVVADEQARRRDRYIARIQSTFAASTGTVIRPGWVASLLRDPLSASPYDPNTWWRNSSVRGVTARIGQLGATHVAQLEFHSGSGGVGALIGGRPGSGKSILMHSMIMSLVTEYSPVELELYLIDFKEGVEFKCYSDAKLPHAKAIAIEAEREFGIAVLEGMVSEIGRRGELFKAAAKAKLDDYRQLTNEPMPRQITIIDEFQKLFEKDDRLAQQASNLIERILREGRAFGLHLVLSSQTTQGMQGLDRHVLALMPTRVALRTSPQDSEAILGEGNVAAKDLNRAGEGIINVKQGNPDANERFQTTFWHTETTKDDTSDQHDVLAALRTKADHAGITATPRVFAGNDRTPVTPETVSDDAIPVGLPVSLDPPFAHRLRREGGANLLVVDAEPSPLIAAVAAAVHAGHRIRLFDFVAGEDDWGATIEALAANENVTVVGRRSLDEQLAQIAAVVADRVEFDEFKSPTEIVVLAGLHRARDLDPDAYDEDSPSNRVHYVARNGPEVGVHVWAWADRGGVVSRRLSHQSMREFGLRLIGACSTEDSQALLDSDAGSTLKPNQAIFEDHERGVTRRVLTYGSVPHELLRGGAPLADAVR